MDANGQSRPKTRSSGKPETSPTSPHMQIWRWTVTMAASITHRVTGVALAAARCSWCCADRDGVGPDAYASLRASPTTPGGQSDLFGLVWSLAFHLLNGIRHLAWDVGYGFKMSTSRLTAVLVYAGSLLIAASAFAVGMMVRGGLGL